MDSGGELKGSETMDLFSPFDFDTGVRFSRMVVHMHPNNDLSPLFLH